MPGFDALRAEIRQSLTRLHKLGLFHADGARTLWLGGVSAALLLW